MEHMIKIQSNKVDLVGTLHLPKDRTQEGKYPLVIICHGFIGNRIGVNRLFVKAAREFALQGFAVLRFDYEGCGESLGDYGSYGFDRFIQQTKDVIDFAASIPHVDQNQIFLLGHSLGGAIAALTASTDQRINKLIMWAAVGHPFHDLVKIVGYENYQKLLSHPFIDHEGFALTKHFFESIAEYRPLEAARSFTGDVLVLHGTDDQEIPVDYCTQYQHAFKRGRSKGCSKEVITGADHTFSTLDGCNQLFRSTIQWLVNQTKRQGEKEYQAI